MQPINIIRSKAVPLPLPNIDTDQIIPKQFLKRIERTGYGDFLFFDWRRIQEGVNAGEPNPDFVLNRPEYNGAEILIAIVFGQRARHGEVIGDCEFAAGER